MGSRVKKNNPVESYESVHQNYMDIINALPDIVYWIDKDCFLKGCNSNFVEFFGLKRLKDFKGSPYDQMGKLTKWSQERIEALRLDDMRVIFSGEAQFAVDILPLTDSDGNTIYFRCNRVPFLDKNKQVTGMVVILTDVSAYKNLQKSETETIESVPTKPIRYVEEPHVLMVEDNYIAQKVEEAVLKGLHCLVDIADTGDKALQLFNPGKYDIVLMDIGLEDTSGYMVAKQFREKEKDTSFHVPIIALTSYQADVVKYDCNDYFMDGVITKPLTTEQAQQLIQKFIYNENVGVEGLKSV